MDRVQLADLLRSRRVALQPEDVGLPRGSRRRARGLRREEVALLCQMSTDYYTRIEQQRGPVPSETMLASIARGLRLSPDERDHLFRTAGREAPRDRPASEHVSPGMMRVLERLQDTPAQIVSSQTETLAQTPAAVALVGDECHFSGLDRSLAYRWFTRTATRRIYPDADHSWHSRMFAAQMRDVYSRQGADSPAGRIVGALLEESEEFATLWGAHEVGVLHDGYRKRIRHPELGVLDLQCQLLQDADQAHGLLVYTAAPGTASYDKLKLLPTIQDETLMP